VTEAERQAIRAAISEARRRRIRIEELCQNCEREFDRVSEDQIYCSRRCQLAAWQRTPKGRAIQNASRARRRAAKAQTA